MIKFFHYNKEDRIRYLMEWKGGYVLFSSEWKQIRYKRFNWITFVLIEFEIERELGNGISIHLGCMGFRLLLNWIWKPSNLLKELEQEEKKIKKGLKEGKSYKELGLKKLKI